MIQLFMSPGRNKLSMVLKVVEKAVMDFVTSKICHVSPTLTKETTQGEIG